MPEKSTKKSVISTLMLLLIAAVMVAVCNFSVMLFPTKPPKQSDSVEQFVQTLQKNVFEVKVGNTIATGFFVSKSERGAIAVTCWHSVKEDASAIEIKEFGNSEFISGAELLGYDVDYDIAVFEVEGDRDIVDLSVTVKNKPQNVGAEVFLLGNSTGAGIAFHDGAVSVADEAVLCRDSSYGSNINGKYLPAVRITAAVNYGSSGCPVFNKNGEWIGMGFYQVFGTTERPVYDMSYALPSNVVLSVVKAAELKRGAIERDKLSLSSGIAGEGETAIRVSEINTPYGKFTQRDDEWFFESEEVQKIGIKSINGNEICSVANICSIFVDFASGYVGKIQIEFIGGGTVIEK